jgi:cysteinyl-tRNA synthetase
MMYACGPTVYGPSHIGHARSVIVFDVVARYFRVKGLEVIYVRNFTDVDDKIINRAAEECLTCTDVSEKYIDEFYRDMDALHVARATHEPRATEYIPAIIRVIQRLIDNKSAYAAGGDVFFAVNAFPGYGKLSGRKLEDMMAGARIEVDERKKSPFDFVLWKAEKPGEPSWDSPWGKGRPGWHIECSAMSAELLGETFDIHGGGQDLIFPHHENEIAQSEAAFGKPFARFWMHNGFVRINQEKMSKSLNNFLTVKEMVDAFHPEVIRLFLLSSHYRSPVDFSEESMRDAAAGLDKLYLALQRADERRSDNPPSEGAGTHWQEFCQAMDDDFNTARGIGTLFDAARALNRLLDEAEAGQQSPDMIAAAAGDMRRMGNVLGLFNVAPRDYFERQKAAAAAQGAVDPAEIERLIAARRQARKDRNFAEADRIRGLLTEMKVVLEDRPDGTTAWKFET